METNVQVARVRSQGHGSILSHSLANPGIVGTHVQPSCSADQALLHPASIPEVWGG